MKTNTRTFWMVDRYSGALLCAVRATSPEHATREFHRQMESVPGVITPAGLAPIELLSKARHSYWRTYDN